MDTYRRCTPFLVIFLPWIGSRTTGELFINIMQAAYLDTLPQAATSDQGRWDPVRLSVSMPRSYAHCCNRGIDFTPTASDRVLPDETPIIVVLHGLTGGSCTHPDVV